MPFSKGRTLQVSCPAIIVGPSIDKEGL
jgi:hypothetical protein